jgi:glutathione synthase/RimK-type ligase-like ATP-grasp enzyme
LILIFSFQDDVHAEAVAWALRRKGQDALLCDLQTLPESGGLHFELVGRETPRLILELAGRSVDLLNATAAWIRRPRTPELRDRLHPDDVGLADASWKAALASLLAVLDHSGVRLVNAPATMALDLAKPYQLMLAREVGLATPDTVIGNAYGAVARVFANETEIVFKSFSTETWTQRGDDGSTSIRKGYATTIDARAEARWRTLRQCPAIAQSVVRKSFDARVTVIGDEVYVLAIRPIERTAALDWRGFNPTAPQYEFRAMVAPAEVEEALRAYRLSAGLAYMTADFAVTDDGAWIFLEANNAGQFLWCEEFDASLPLLDRFARLLIGKGSEDGPTVTFAEYRAAQAAAAEMPEVAV